MLCGGPDYHITILWGRRNDKAHPLDRSAAVDDWLLLGLTSGSCRVGGGPRTAPSALLVPPRTAAIDAPPGARWELLAFDVIRVPLRPPEDHPAGTTRIHIEPRPQPGPVEVWGTEFPLEIPEAYCAGAFACLRFCGDHWWRGDRGRARADAHLQAWLTEYACGRARSERFAGGPVWLRPVGDAIEDGLEAGVTVTSLARAARMSRQTFHRRFVAVVGECPAAYLLRERIDRAAHYLAQTDAPVAMVAKRIGYRSRTTFARLFKERYGMTPSAWRRERG